METEDDQDGSPSEPEGDTHQETVDGGWGWMVVLGAFFINVITDGCSYSFGVLFTHLVEYFHANRSSTAWVGSVFNASPLLFGPFASIIAKRFGFRKTTIAGGLIAAVGIFASVFVNSLALLSFTYGCVAGFGISLPYLASSVVVMMYFKKRRSLATGLAECGAGVGTLIFAPLLQFLISEYGWRGSLLVLSAIMLNIVLCGSLFRPQPLNVSKNIDRRTSVPHDDENCEFEISVSKSPEGGSEDFDSGTENCAKKDKRKLNRNLCVENESLRAESHSLLGGSLNSISNNVKTSERFSSVNCLQTENKHENNQVHKQDEPNSNSSSQSCMVVDLHLFCNWRFVIFLIANFILYFWYDVPYVFTVDRVLEIGESETQGALILSSIGIVHTIGNIVFGFLGDLKKVNRPILYCVSMWITGLGLALVPLSRDILSFAVFDGMYGFFVAASEALSCVLVTDILGISKVSDGYGILMFLQGVANLVGPPFAGFYSSQ